jgi:hypothetical protein
MNTVDLPLLSIAGECYYYYSGDSKIDPDTYLSVRKYTIWPINGMKGAISGLGSALAKDAYSIEFIGIVTNILGCLKIKGLQMV